MLPPWQYIRGRVEAEVFNGPNALRVAQPLASKH